MKLTTCARWLALVPAFATQMSASAAELDPLPAIELRKFCVAYGDDPRGNDAQACATYLRGFIDGSSLVYVDLLSPPDESFSQRAYRTRLGNASRVRPRYCLNGSVTIAELVIQILVQAESYPPTEAETASDLIQATLNRFHRCRSGGRR
jgi:hypothetical protein